ncbi:MAG: glycosyl hydrolase family 28-related protein, partial [Anaerolineae bacterium]
MRHPIDAQQFGTRGDGISDDTSALQRALDAASAQGGIVQLAPGQYRITGTIRIPVGVHLQGAAMAPQYIKPLLGTVILAYAGRDDETGPVLFDLGDSCSVSGVTVFYPEQKPRDIHPYPYTFHLYGGDNTVENVTLINSYNGIQIGPEPTVRHRIRSVYGCVLRRGIFLDSCSDIGRLDNVQFHCHWWSAPEVGGEWEPVFEYMWQNCEAFIFGRSDWEYVTNTFVFPVKTGYWFIKTERGATNAQLCGIGAAAAQ